MRPFLAQPGTFVRVLGAAMLCGGSAAGCLVTKAKHDTLALRVTELEGSLSAQADRLDRQLGHANELVTKLEAKLSEAEALLRRNQADLGVRVESLEGEVQALRGASENAQYVAAAAGEEMKEVRADLDVRLRSIEEKLNEATNIPETKAELVAAAEKHLVEKRYVQARRMFRTYVSRYPDDTKLPEVRFKIGLTYFNERDYKSSLGEFYRVIQDSPEAEVVADSLYYSGLAFAKLGQCKSAEAYFEALRGPTSKASKRYRDAAAKQIEIMKKDGGELCTDVRGPDAKASGDAKKPTTPAATPR